VHDNIELCLLAASLCNGYFSMYIYMNMLVNVDTERTLER